MCISFFVFISAFAQVGDDTYYEDDYYEEDYEVEQTLGEQMTVEEALEYEETSNEKIVQSKSVDDHFKDRYKSSEYDYTETKKQPKPAIAKAPAPKSVNIGGFAKILFNILLVLAIGAVVYVLYLLFKDFKINRHTKVEKAETHSEEEAELAIEKLDKTDLETQIAKAIENENYTLATRFYFLLYLQKLQLKEYITYHKDKTNSDYHAELTKDELQLQFIKVSYLFEYVWYGKKPLNEESFTQLEQTFKTQITLVK